MKRRDAAKALLTMGLVGGGLATPQAASASTFTDTDTAEWVALDKAFLDLLNQIKEATDALPSAQSNAVIEFVMLYLQLEALHERMNHLLSLVAFSALCDSVNDERRMLRGLKAMLIPSSRTLAQFKRSSLIKIASATSAGGLYPHYVASALTLIDTKVLPLLDKTDAKIVAGQ